MDPINLCMGCMEAANGAALCPACGYTEGTAPESPLYLAPRTVLREQYVIGRVLGHGGFGITYIGWDLDLARRIAVKEYFPSGVAIRTGGSNVFPYSGNLQKDYEWGLDRYLDEARVLARFHNHPNIAWVQQFFRANGTAYIVLEYLDGITFEKFIERRGGKVPWEPALEIMLPVMDALREVHRADLLHRDVSPDNVYVLRTGQVKLIDFGAARYALGQQSKNLSIILKEGYAPEEQYRSKGNQGPWTDVYATASTLYRAITGRIPPPALDRQRQDELAPPSALGVALPAAQERALLKALAIRAEDRFADMGAFQNALLEQPAAAPLPLPPRPNPVPAPVPVPPTPVPVPPPVPPHFPKWLMAVAAAVVLLVGAVAVKLGGGEKAPVISTFAAEPTQVAAGQPVTLRWSVANAEYVSIDDVPGKQAPAGSAQVTPAGAKTFRLVAVSKGGAKTESALKVDVRAVEAPPRLPAEIVRFIADPTAIRAGQSSTVSWAVNNAAEISINGQKVPNTGNAKVSPKSTTTFTLVATGPDGEPRQSAVTIEVGGDGGGTPKSPPHAEPEPVFRIAGFAAQPLSVTAGQPVTLSWSVMGARNVFIGPEPGAVPASGQVSITPRAGIRYLLTATDARGRQLTSMVQVNVVSISTPVQPPVQQPQQPRGLAWQVGHDHQGGILGSAGNRYQWAHCEGRLMVAGGRLKFSANMPNHNFDVALVDIIEVRTNRIPIRGYKAFHVKLRNGENYNFISDTAPASIVDEIQAKMR